MGFFDDVKKFSDEWGGKATETLRNLSPTTQQIGKELDIITGVSDDKPYVQKAVETVQDWGASTTETLRNIDPTTQQIGKELDIITGKSDDKPYVQKVADLITADVPDLSNVPADIGKALEQSWNDSSKPIWERESGKKILGEDTAADIKKNVDNIPNVIIQPVKETVTNVTKGVSEALPILAIGAGGLILASLLLGRR